MSRASGTPTFIVDRRDPGRTPGAHGRDGPRCPIGSPTHETIGADPPVVVLAPHAWSAENVRSRMAARSDPVETGMHVIGPAFTYKRIRRGTAEPRQTQ